MKHRLLSASAFVAIAMQISTIASAETFRQSLNSCRVNPGAQTDSYDLPTTGDISLVTDAILSDGDLEVDVGADYTAEIEPALELDFSSGRRVINLTPQNNRSKSLVHGDFRNGFQVVDHRSNDFGLGASLNWNRVNSTGLAKDLWLSVGLLPIKGKEIVSVRHVQDAETAHNLPKIKALPTSVAALNSFATGDALTYMSHGGLVFWGGADISVFGLKAIAYAKGSFQVYLEKIDDSHVFVKLTDKNLTQFGIQAEAAIIEMELSRFKEYSKGLSFLVNYKDPAGAQALVNILAGNIALAQKSAGNAVTPWDKSQGTRVGRMSQLEISFPFLFSFSWANSKIFETSQTNYLACNRVLDANYNVFMYNKEKSYFDTYQDRKEIFYGASYQLKDVGSKQGIAKGFFGKLVWAYERDNASARSLRRAMNKLASETGLGDKVVLNVPNVDNLDFTALKMRMHFSQEITNQLIANAKAHTAGSLRNLGQRLVRNYFKNGDNDGICHTGENNYVDCQEQFRSTIETNVSDMITAIKKMDAALKRGNDKEAIKQYAKFGEGMLKNQFLFKLGVILAGEGLKMDYVVEGSEISRYSAAYETNADGEFVPASAAGIARR